MTEARNRRQQAIAELIRNDCVASQEELTEALEKKGFKVTQATVSRDLDKLGAVKARRGGLLCYSLPEQLAHSDFMAAQLERILKEWVQSIEPAGNLIVLKTPPGSAHLVGVALDQAKLGQVVGTICGDDTLFVAARSAKDGRLLAERLLKMWRK
jgi:transcriptional regulator of arginine metabolism